MKITDAYGQAHEAGKKDSKPVSVFAPHGNPKFLIKYVNAGSYIDGIGYSQI